MVTAIIKPVMAVSSTSFTYNGKHDNIYSTVMPKHVQNIIQNTYLLSVVEITNQVHAFHEPPSLRPHCSSAQ